MAAKLQGYIRPGHGQELPGYAVLSTLTFFSSYLTLTPNPNPTFGRFSPFIFQGSLKDFYAFLFDIEEMDATSWNAAKERIPRWIKSLRVLLGRRRVAKPAEDDGI